MGITNEELLQEIEILKAEMQQVRDGSIVTHISEAIHWLSTPVRLTGGTDYTVDGTFTDLDLNKWTSNKAKYVFLQLIHGVVATPEDFITVRKNGETPTYPQITTCQVAGVIMYGFAMCAMDSNQVIEYQATDASDTLIDILGYIE